MKKIIRKEKIRARNTLTTHEIETFSNSIVNNIISSSFYKSAHTILIYRSTKNEVSLQNLEIHTAKDDKKLVYPRCVSKSEMIALCPSENGWEQGSYGIWEPIPELSELISPEEIDFVICPCTAFDEDCGRIGMGAGYYDRYLEKCVNAHITAVAFEVQKVPAVPMDAYDKYMEAVFTEKNIYFRTKKEP